MTHDDSVIGYWKPNMWRTERMGENILWCDETIIELFSCDTKHFVWQNQHHPCCEVWWQPHEVRKQQNELKKANFWGQPALEYLRLFSAANVYNWIRKWHKQKAKDNNRTASGLKSAQCPKLAVKDTKPLDLSTKNHTVCVNLACYFKNWPFKIV